MRSYPFWRVDVFASRPLEGNPLAVFPNAKGLGDAEMLAIAREMNLSETTFIEPPTLAGADYHTRIFTPGGEVPFAGHPTLGTAFVAAEEGIVGKSEGIVTVHQQDGVGLTPVKLEITAGSVRRIIMTQAKPKLGRHIKPVTPIAAALGIKPRDILATGLLPQISWTGLSALMVPVRSPEVVAGIRPDERKLAKILGRFGKDPGAFVFAFQQTGLADLHARAFFPLFGIPEDPATGSAAGACGAYLAANGVLPDKQWFIIEQGIEIHHPSRIEVAVAVERGRPTQVRVGGSVVPVMRGTLELE
jgi:trans-2,3-dihydro-3-hydroxyanthranilate isomerase